MAAWKSKLLKAVDGSAKPMSTFFSLATVRPNGKPANRMMVYRGFLPNSDSKLTFVTDHRGAERLHTSMSPAESSPYRTEKLEEFGHQSWAEICWYLNDTREQFRLGGQLASIDGSDPDKDMLQERQKAWEQQSSNTKKWHAQPHPGKPAEGEPEPQKDYETEEPLPEFVLVVMDVDSVDYLHLKENTRISYTSKVSNGKREWDEQPINP